jgi:hypothetical protein
MFELIGKGVVFIGTSIYSMVLSFLIWQLSIARIARAKILQFPIESDESSEDTLHRYIKFFQKKQLPTKKNTPGRVS